MTTGSIVARLGLDKKDFRTGMESARDDLGIFKKASLETDAAIALLQRRMKDGGGSAEQKRQLADLTAAHKGYQREIFATERQIKALSAAAGGGGTPGGGIFGGLKNLGSSLVGFSGIGAVLGGLGSIGGIVTLGKELLSFAHDTRTAAESVNLDVEKFQRLRAVFGKNGADEEVFTHGVGKLTENIQSARAGDVKKEESFAGLGVSFQDLNQLSPDQVLLKIADAAAHSTNPTKTFAEVIDVLGKSGLKMLPGLKMGGEAIEAMGEKVKVASRESIEAAEAAQRRFMGFTSRQTGATLEGAYRYYDGFRKTDGAGAVARMVGRDLLEDDGPAAGSGSKVIEALRAPIARGPIGAISRLFGRVTGNGDFNDGGGSEPDVTTLGGGDKAPTPAATEAASTFKGALELKKDELALEERLRAIQRAGDDAEVKAAQAKLAAAREILANAQKNPTTDGVTLVGLSGKVGAAEDAERLAKRSSTERKEELADQMALNDLQGRGAAAHLLALSQEEARLTRRMNSPAYGPDEKAGFAVNLGRNANDQRAARRAYLSEQDANIGLEIQNRHTGRGPAERVRLLDEQLADNARRKGNENSGDVSPEAVGRWQRLNLEAAALRREKSDILFDEEQSLAAAQGQTQELALHVSGQNNAANAAARNLATQQGITVALRNGNVELANQIQAQGNLNTLAEEVRRKKLGAGGRAAEDAGEVAEARVTQSVQADRRNKRAIELAAAGLGPAAVEARLTQEGLTVSTKARDADTEGGSARGQGFISDGRLGSLRLAQNNQGAYNPRAEGDTLPFDAASVAAAVANAATGSRGAHDYGGPSAEDFGKAVASALKPFLTNPNSDEH